MKKLSIIFFGLCFIGVTSCIKERTPELSPDPLNSVYMTYVKIDNDTTFSGVWCQNFMLDASTGDSNSTYNWSIYGNTSTKPIMYFTAPNLGSYLGQVDIYTNGVHKVDTFIIIIEDINTFYFPNSFTPNGDLYNDVWLPKGINIDPNDYMLKIYNNNDFKVFSTTDLNEGWNGSIDNENEPCPAGLYYFVFKYKKFGGDEQILHGELQLIR